MDKKKKKDQKRRKAWKALSYLIPIIITAVVAPSVNAYVQEALRPKSLVEVVQDSINIVPMFSPSGVRDVPVGPVSGQGVIVIWFSFSVKNNGGVPAESVTVIISAPESWISRASNSSVVVYDYPKPIRANEAVLASGTFETRDGRRLDHGSFTLQVKVRWGTGESNTVSKTISW